MEPRSPPVQFRSTDTISASTSSRPCTRTRSSSPVTSIRVVARRCASTDRMISSNSSATWAVRTRSPERVAAWLSMIHASSRPSSSEGQPSQTLCARTAKAAPISPTASTEAPRGRDLTSPAAIRSNPARCGASAAGARNGSNASRNAVCIDPSSPLGTCRNRDTPFEKLRSSSATRRTKSCRSTTHSPRSLRTTGC